MTQLRSDGYPMKKIKVDVAINVAVLVLDDGEGAVTQRAETVAASAVHAAIASRTNWDREDEGITSHAKIEARAVGP
jgi:hypothetical protein